MSTTLPNLPALSASPAHTLTDADIVHVNHSASPGVGGDRKVTLAELREVISPDPEYAALGSIGSCEMVGWNSNDPAVVEPAAHFSGSVVQDKSGYYHLRAAIMTPVAPTWTGTPLSPPVMRIRVPTASSALWSDFWDAMSTPNEYTRPIGYCPVTSSSLGSPYLDAAPLSMPKVTKVLIDTDKCIEIRLRNIRGQETAWSAMLAAGGQVRFNFEMSLYA